jgi:hypothetical protein
MFKRGNNYANADEIRAAGDAVKYSTGSAVAFRANGATVAVRLESPNSLYRSPGDLRDYGPADSLGSALAAILRHITGTPQEESVDVPEDDDSVRYTPVPAVVEHNYERQYVPAPSGLQRQAIEKTAQADVIAYLMEMVDTWENGNSGPSAVISYHGLRKAYTETRERIENGTYLSGSQF